MKKIQILFLLTCQILLMNSMLCCSPKIIILPNERRLVDTSQLEIVTTGTNVCMEAQEWFKIQDTYCFDKGYYDKEIAEKLDRCAAILQLEPTK